MAKRNRRWRSASAVEDVEARAARLGITVERVLQKYASLAFADLRRIADGPLQPLDRPVLMPLRGRRGLAWGWQRHLSLSLLHHCLLNKT